MARHTPHFCYGRSGYLERYIQHRSAVFQPSLHPPALCHGRLAQTFSRSKNWADTRRRRSRKNQECVKQQEAAGACGGAGVSSSPLPPPPSIPRTLREVTRRPTASRCLVASISLQWQRHRAVVEVTAGAVMTTLAPLTEL